MLSDGEKNYTYDARNSLTNADGLAYTYDNRGNLISADGAAYEFDVAGNLFEQGD